MRYHYEKPKLYSSMYGRIYRCNHPVYNECTVYLIKNKGLAVIQQRYDKSTKRTWWGKIDDYLVDDIYLNPHFKEFFDNRAKASDDGLYPTVSIRQIMWALKIKPLPREPWETYFDRKEI